MASNTLSLKSNASGTLTYMPRKEITHRNVLTRMTKELSVGPFSLLLRSIQEHVKIRVWTRSYNHVRGICTGYVVAYDKHFNMALCDVDEVYRNPSCLQRQSCTTNKKRRKKKKRCAKSKLEVPTLDVEKKLDDVSTKTEEFKEESDEVRAKATLTQDEVSVIQSSSGTIQQQSSKIDLLDTATEEEFCPIYEDYSMSGMDDGSIENSANDLVEQHPETSQSETELPQTEEALVEHFSSLKARLAALPSDSDKLSDISNVDQSDSDQETIKYKRTTDIPSHGKSSVTDLREKLLRKRASKADKPSQSSCKQHYTSNDKTSRSLSEDSKESRRQTDSSGSTKSGRSSRHSRSSRDGTRGRSRERETSVSRSLSEHRKDYWSERRDRVRGIRDRSGESMERSSGKGSSWRAKSKRTVSDERRNRHQQKDNRCNQTSESVSRVEGSSGTRAKNTVRRRRSISKESTSKRQQALTNEEAQNDELTSTFQTKNEVLSRHVNQLFIRGDNVVMIALVT